MTTIITLLQFHKFLVTTQLQECQGFEHSNVCISVDTDSDSRSNPLQKADHDEYPQPFFRPFLNQSNHVPVKCVEIELDKGNDEVSLIHICMSHFVWTLWYRVSKMTSHLL